MERVVLRRFATTATVVLGAAAFATSAVAADYQSIGVDAAILYDAPTARANRVAIAPLGMPVEVILVQGDWVRVRDSQGGLAWVERRAVSPTRTAIANGAQSVDVLARPMEDAPVVFRVAPGVLLDVTSAPANGWVAVRHRDGQTGFVRVGNVWEADASR